MSALNIAIVGGGRIGSAFAFQLARVGKHDVTIIARPGSKRLERLQADKGVLTSQGELASVAVHDALNESIAYDLVIVAVQDSHVDAVLPVLKRSSAKLIQFLFTTFTPDRLLAAVGAERAAVGMPFVQSDFDSEGRIGFVVPEGRNTRVGSQKSADIFAGAGIPADYDEHMTWWLRCNAPLSVAFESVSVAAFVQDDETLKKTAVILGTGIHATFELIRSQGGKLYPEDKVQLDQQSDEQLGGMLYGLSQNVPFRTLLASGEGECRAVVDSILAAAGSDVDEKVRAAILAMKPPPYKIK